MDALRGPDLYPPIAPASSGLLAVGDGHEIYWEECGSATGIPVLYLHGGPGAGCLPAHRRFFDPARYRVVLFDQRGCGRSLPLGRVEANTTALLVADIETLRRRLGIGRWLVTGGSWGSTLALAYGEAFPERCLGFILRGVFLFEAAEVDWFLHGMGRFFPEAEARLLSLLSPAERGDVLAAYARRLADPDPAVHGPAAHLWNAYEHACSTLLGNHGSEALWAVPAAVGGDVLALARLEVHYMRNAGFLAPGQLMAGLSRIRHLPAAVLQGRYDMVCPPATALRLAAAWPGTEIAVIPDAGHSVFEPGTRAAMVRFADAFADHCGTEPGSSPFRL